MACGGRGGVQPVTREKMPDRLLVAMSLYVTLNILPTIYLIMFVVAKQLSDPGII